MLTFDEARTIAAAWSTGKLRRYVFVAGRLWPDDVRLIAARDELARRQERS